jgi:HSP20 family protein
MRSSTGLARREFFPFGFLQREIDRLFDDVGRGFGAPLAQQMLQLVPDIDIAETDKNYEITVELPGLERKDVDVSLDGNVLTVRAEKKAETQQTNGQTEAQKDAPQDAQKQRNVHVSERSYGVFYRMIQLPVAIDPSSVQATMSNGVLKIVIPKPADNQARKIEVKEAA